MADEDVLPKAPIAKLLKTIVHNKRVSGEYRDILVSCATEFFQLVSSQALEVSNREKRKKLSEEHVYQAMEELGFGDYVKELKVVDDESRAQRTEKKREKKSKTSKSPEELKAAQEALFAKARLKTGISKSELVEQDEQDEEEEDIDNDESLDDANDSVQDE